MGDLGPTQPSALLNPGELVKGRYRVTRHIGSGGFGAVFLAQDKLLHDRHVVVKVIFAANNPDPWFRRKFEDEIEALARIDHPGVVNVLDCGELDRGQPFLVMQFIDGATLRSEIRDGGLDRRRSARLLEQIGAALSAAHALGICHRDLKPENIMLQRTGDRTEHVRLIDFGIASLQDPTAQVPTRIAGSPAYMAREQLAGQISPACDIYALGVIAHEMLSGRRPKLYNRVPLSTIPAAAAQLLDRALSEDPSKRPQSAALFTAELAVLLVSDRLSTATHSPAARRPEPPLGRLVAKLCNRRAQESDFRAAFTHNAQSQPGVPQFYVIHGDEGQCHDSLVDRLTYWVEQWAQQRFGEANTSVVRKKIPWQHDGAVDARWRRLESSILDAFSVLAVPGGIASLRQLASEMLANAVVLQHDIRAARWDAHSAPLIRSYREALGALTPDTAAPQLVVFCNVIYPLPAPASAWNPAGWLASSRGKRLREAIQRDLAPRSAAEWRVLSELEPVTRDDVMEWFTLHNIFESEDVWIAKAEAIFREQARRPMAEIETCLRGLHDEFLREKGYV